MKILIRKGVSVKIETHKIPDIVFSVMKSIRENASLCKVDVYVHMLSNLTEKECYYLLNNRSNELFDNDLEFLIETLTSSLKLYENEEEYELCQEIFTSIEIYRKILKS
jgi:hypothetical protein